MKNDYFYFSFEITVYTIMKITLSWYLFYYQVCNPEDGIVNVEKCLVMINLNFRQ
jgi:hypothetical protein